MGTATAAESSQKRRWLLFSLRAGPFRIFNLCLRRQPLKWQSQSNLSKESFDSLKDPELGREPATTSRTSERGTENLSEKSVELEQPSASEQDRQAAEAEGVELQSALQELAAETDLLRRLNGTAAKVLGELKVLTKIWESQTLLRMGPAASDSTMERRSQFESRFRAAISSWVLSEETHRNLQELLKTPEAGEFLNSATMVAAEELLASSADCLEQAGKRRELTEILRRADPTEAEKTRAAELLDDAALKGHPVLEFKVRRALGLPMTVQWTAELGLGSGKVSVPDLTGSPRFARTIPSNISDVDA